MPVRLPDGRIVVGQFTILLPSEWVVKPTTHRAHVLDVKIPSHDGEPARLVVEYFGAAGQGAPSEVTDRWVAPYVGDDGKPSLDYIAAKHTFGGQEARTVSVEGRVADRRDQALMGVVIESPQGPYYFRLTGSGRTLDPNRQRWWAMLDSLAATTEQREGHAP
jgi:hypothetical protein